jgi:hypothetical protein
MKSKFSGRCFTFDSTTQTKKGNFMRHFRFLFSLLVLSAVVGCTTMEVEQLKVMAARPDTRDLTIQVDKNAFNDAGEAVALENGLKRQFANSGYRIAENGSQLRARIKSLVRGNTFANAFIGMGVGKDAIEVEVELRGKAKELLMSFVVKSEILDKRYDDLNTVLTETLPAKVVKQIQDWESVKR